jgi:hypothetical protein
MRETKRSQFLMLNHASLQSMINDTATDTLIYWATDGASFFSMSLSAAAYYI